MKRYFLFLTVLILGAATINAEPLLLEKAGNYNQAGVMELGIDRISYSSDLTKFEDIDMETSLTQIAIPLMARYALSSNFETEVRIPYQINNAETTVGNTSTTEDTSGLGNSKVSLKFSKETSNSLLGLKVSGLFNTGGDDFPMGFDIDPLFLIRKNFSPVYLNVNMGYKITGKYEENDGTKVDPGDILNGGIGLEFSYNNKLTLASEILIKKLTKSSVDGNNVIGSDGLRLGWSAGGDYNLNDNIEVTFGTDVSLGEEKYRNYDFKIITGIRLRK